MKIATDIDRVHRDPDLTEEEMAVVSGNNSVDINNQIILKRSCSRGISYRRHRRGTMHNMTLSAIGLVGGLLYSGVAPAQTAHIAPPNPPLPSPEDQQFDAAPIRIDSLRALPNMPSLNIKTPSGSFAHIFPTTQTHAQRRSAMPAADAGPLLYHGGEIVQEPHLYQIFWKPKPKLLQNGGATGYGGNYVNVNVALAANYNGHGIGNITTQYYQNVNGAVAYPENNGFLVEAVYDRNPYPPSGCNDTATPGNCITDAQLQAELVKEIQAMKWQIGLNSIFIVYTSSGEGSCMASDNQSCAYTQYCAYHSAIVPPDNDINNVILYVNVPFGNPTVCSAGKSPNNDVFADAAASSVSHELTETITDPLGTAWYTSQGNEIGDICAYNYQNNAYASGLANQLWSGFPFELQTEFDNQLGQCAQIGPL